MSRSPPLVPGRIHGVRRWTVKLGRGSLLLTGLNDCAWEPGGKPTRARCRPYHGGPPRGHDPDHAPGQDCGCGLYAMHPWPGQVREVAGSLLHDAAVDRPDIPVMGIVEAWGRIEVHSDGLRAQYARPRALIHFPGSLPHDYGDLVAVVARTYGAEMVELEDAEAIVAYCGEQARGMDAAAVDRLLSEPATVEDEAEEIIAPDGVNRGGRTSSPGGSGWRSRESVLEGIGNALFTILIGVFAVVWYGFWVLAGIAILGAIFLGWWDEPAPPPPKPAPALRLVEERLVREGRGSTYIAIVRNRSDRLAAVGVYPFGEFVDRRGHRIDGPDRRRRVELHPTIPPGATGVIYDELGIEARRVRELHVRFAAKMKPARHSPFTVGPVRINRRLCIVTTRLRSRRSLERSRVSVIARDPRGRMFAAGTFEVGPVRPGVGRQVLLRLDPADCAEPPPEVTGYPAPDPGQVLLRTGER